MDNNWLKKMRTALFSDNICCLNNVPCEGLDENKQKKLVGQFKQKKYWLKETVSDHAKSIPNMNTSENRQYYKWLAKSFGHLGANIELGCWLGQTTACLVEGLRENRFLSNKLIVYDAFVWMDWMNDFCSDPRFKNLKNFDSIDNWFYEFTKPYKNEIVVKKGAIRGSEVIFDSIPEIEWNGSPIGILINDFWDDQEICEEIWAKFSPGFMSGKTIIVFNQYSNVQADALRDFVCEHQSELVALHKPYGPLKSFLYHSF